MAATVTYLLIRRKIVPTSQDLAALLTSYLLPFAESVFSLSRCAASLAPILRAITSGSPHSNLGGNMIWRKDQRPTQVQNVTARDSQYCSARPPTAPGRISQDAMRMRVETNTKPQRRNLRQESEIVIRA